MDFSKLNILIVTFITGILFAISFTVTVVWWASGMDGRVESLERQTKSQWERISANTAISEQVSRIDERTATIMEMLKD